MLTALDEMDASSWTSNLTSLRPTHLQDSPLNHIPRPPGHSHSASTRMQHQQGAQDRHERHFAAEPEVPRHAEGALVQRLTESSDIGLERDRWQLANKERRPSNLIHQPVHEPLFHRRFSGAANLKSPPTSEASWRLQELLSRLDNPVPLRRHSPRAKPTTFASSPPPGFIGISNVNPIRLTSQEKSMRSPPIDIPYGSNNARRGHHSRVPSPSLSSPTRPKPLGFASAGERHSALATLGETRERQYGAPTRYLEPQRSVRFPLGIGPFKYKKYDVYSSE
jgi:hypothetical protein